MWPQWGQTPRPYRRPYRVPGSHTSKDQALAKGKQGCLTGDGWAGRPRGLQVPGPPSPPRGACSRTLGPHGFLAASLPDAAGPWGASF